MHIAQKAGFLPQPLYTSTYDFIRNALYATVQPSRNAAAVVPGGAQPALLSATKRQSAGSW